ncbi:unannotated protein [freshwater metagenome]|uniref:Unannotated protein n=1 Tax=freshwater metagenome TaxID=449393 RepID=A0A6J7DXA0_9ZZZZ
MWICRVIQSALMRKTALNKTVITKTVITAFRGKRDLRSKDCREAKGASRYGAANDCIEAIMIGSGKST